MGIKPNNTEKWEVGRKMEFDRKQKCSVRI